YRDPGRAAEAAARQRICSAGLLRERIADRIIPERPDAADERAEFLRRAARALQAELAGLRRSPPRDRAEARYQRYRRLGS
ncbi:MAG: acetyl-CoA carboxyl transferase, partial [Actinobacteria bacterium]|nr:acetyl-CoA carboxyl transferase [Actinomycetota bacterium]